jgi:PIN domain nuclease of toxin-antitoxin system
MNALQVATNDVLLSTATIWELAIKVGTGKINLSLPFRLWIETAIKDLKLILLPVTVEYAERITTLPPHHRDPFDRMLIAQSLVDTVPVVGVDAVFDSYGVTRIW